MMIVAYSVVFFIIIYLIIIKTRHFVKHIRHKKLVNWFYFNRYSIALSSTQESAAAKKKQNAYTFNICMALLVLVVMFYLQILFML